MGKGFTLVEITIVMLIIGVIAALAIKGKDLVEVANVRSELRKLERFDLAVKTIVLKKSTHGGADAFDRYYPAGSEIVSTFFTDNGSLVDSDFTTYLVPVNQRKSVWRRAFDNESKVSVSSENSITVMGRYTPQEACMVEFIMDDTHPLTGRVSAYPFMHNGAPPDNSTVYNSCADWLNVFESGKNDVTLFYRIM
ncbi:MAG: type II secretion system GspH family protein [Deferribacteraceae bacterium]|jgi:prepilin-type N-terminal cleavage/methylation domain-containing protein|nr:type II secretion system GspH family protein [Deferribacteraceae bacterium]